MKKLIIILTVISSMTFESIGKVSTEVFSGHFSIDDALLGYIIGKPSDTISGNGVFGYYENDGKKIRHGKLVLSIPDGKILGEYSNGNKTGRWILDIDDIHYELNFLQDKITGQVKVEYSENSLSGNMTDNHWVGKVNISEVVNGTPVQYCLNFNSSGMADGIWKIIMTDGSYSKYDFANGTLLAISEYSASTGKTDITYALPNDVKQVIIEENTSSVFSDAEGTQYRLENIETPDFSIAGYNISSPCTNIVFNRMLSLKKNCFMKLVNLTQLAREKKIAEQIAEKKRLEAIEQDNLRQQRLQEEKRVREEALLKKQQEEEKRIREEKLQKQQEMEAYMEMIKDSEPIPFQRVEEKPSFMGGDASTFSKWVAERLVYPEAAKENSVSGRVTLQFTIEADGMVTNVKVLRGVDASLDKEAVRVVSSSPKWTPGKQNDRVVRVQYTFPVIF